jgi:hypothetical protein
LTNFASIGQDCQLNLQGNSYLSLPYKLLYVATPKAACTTLKWWFAELVGLADAVRSATGSAESLPELTIHDTFYRASELHPAPTIAQLEEAISNSSIFRFCVTRNPFTRVFSAWQSKWLLRESLQVAPYINADFMKREPKTATDIAEVFEGFLEYIYRNEHPNPTDPHLKTQFRLLDPESINYSTIIRIEAPEKSLEMLSRHLGSSFHNPFSTKPKNEGAILYHDAFISPRACRIIQELYASDFERFEYTTNPPRSTQTLDPEAVRSALQIIRGIQGRNIRIGQLRSEYQSELASLRASVLEAQTIQRILSQKIDELQHDLRHALQRTIAAETQAATLKKILYSGDDASAIEGSPPPAQIG